MRRHLKHISLPALFLGMAVAAQAQDPGVDRATVPFSDPARPGNIKVSLLSGSITIKGYAGKEVVVEARVRQEEGDRERRRRADPAAGMKRIPNYSTGLSVEEEDNVMSIGTGASQRAVDITLQVPTRVSLKLHTVNDGDVKVEQVQGEIEVNNINGAVTLTQVSGSVVAHAQNGNVKVTMLAVDAAKPMSFTSFNGDVDILLPADLKATVAMKSDQGEIYSDFDVSLEPSAAKPMVESSTGKGSKYKVKVDKTIRGSINGGGPEFQFKTYNGNIYIRKAGAAAAK